MRPAAPARPPGDPGGTLSQLRPATWVRTTQGSPPKARIVFQAETQPTAERWGQLRACPCQLDRDSAGHRADRLPPTVHPPHPWGEGQCLCGQGHFLSAPSAKRASLCPVGHGGSLSSVWERKTQDTNRTQDFPSWLESFQILREPRLCRQ